MTDDGDLHGTPCERQGPKAYSLRFTDKQWIMFELPDPESRMQNNCAGMFTVALVCHSGGDHNEAWYKHPIYYATKSPKPATPRGSSANTQTQASVHEGFDSRTLRLCFLWLPNNGATQHEIQSDVLGGERSGIPPLSIRRQEC
ncbi:predicted protein [Histoplasma capsulatum H143]|uniref:Uncharacterized protein n=1 Tax=Ajellomyces capsulatus (strain H143) TaxID=544712 RepID=C6HHH6_AJECH|nr:predicted protein [Histoplasma capsulatum H143]